MEHSLIQLINDNSFFMHHSAFYPGNAEFFRINSLPKVFIGLTLLQVRNVLSILVVTILMGSCKKHDTNPAGNEVIKGSVSLYVTAKHHTWTVPGLSVFMKRNATEFPGTDTTLYEWRTSTDASGMILIRDLFYGKYFLYAKGYDSLFGANVQGQLPIDLSSSTVQNNEAYYDMAVSE